jgi:hypothetical protein
MQDARERIEPSIGAIAIAVRRCPTGNGCRKVSTTVEGNGDRVGRQQDNLGLEADNRIGIKGEPIPLSHRGKDDRGFHRREGVANTQRSPALRGRGFSMPANVPPDFVEKKFRNT